MPVTPSSESGVPWLAFVLMTVVSWGVYGPLIHWGAMGMADKENGRYKAFLLVGLAYFLTAVLAPLAMLALRKAVWEFPVEGLGWSLLAGIMGACGAFCVLLAFGAKGSPIVVMSIIFAGAPMVNSLFLLILQWRQGQRPEIQWQFILGIILAAGGGFMVTKYRPEAHAAEPKAMAAPVVTAPEVR